MRRGQPEVCLQAVTTLECVLISFARTSLPAPLDTSPPACGSCANLVGEHESLREPVVRLWRRLCAMAHAIVVDPSERVRRSFEFALLRAERNPRLARPVTQSLSERRWPALVLAKILSVLADTLKIWPAPRQVMSGMSQCIFDVTMYGPLKNELKRISDGAHH